MNDNLARVQASPDCETFGNVLNVAAVCRGTYALGPGLRAVVWVQGCPFRCPGCIAPNWLDFKPAHLISPEALLDHLLADPNVTGLTISGGEPMMQAAGLARLAWLARQKRARQQLAIDIICFTGFQRSLLEKHPPVPGVDELLKQIDVLIDGPYIERLNDNRGLRGSQNQRIHYLTDRLKTVDLENNQRKSEIRLYNGQALMIGVPGKRTGEAFNQAIDHAQAHQLEMLQYERI